MLKHTILLGLIGFMALAGVAGFGCQQQTSDEESQDLLRDSIMVVHDEVMPLMSEVNRIQRQLKEFIQDTTIIDVDLLSETRAIIAALESADEGMMSWMNQFTQPKNLRSSKTHAEIMAYLEAEMHTVQQVKSNILTSIEKGTKQLESKFEQAASN